MHKYSNIGCTEKMKRKDMKDHEEDDKVHLHLSINMKQLNIGLKELKGINKVFIKVPKCAEKKKVDAMF